MESDALDRVLARLPSFRRCGAGYTARCPAHADKKPSLTIGLGEDGRVLLCCRVCPTEAVVSALGLTMADLFVPSERPVLSVLRGGKRNGTAALWPLFDASGTPVAIHERYETPAGKRYAWRSPEGVPGLHGTPTAALPLYGLPELLAAPHEAVVYVCEGEKAADALRAVGLLAVATVTGASGTPSDETLAPLVGRDVVLWADGDEVGRKHMARIAFALARLNG